jgi:uncharacterized protein (DUF1697 family)
MPRYVAFLRGVSPMNLKMFDLRRSLEQAGLKDVKTVLSSGNVAFTAPAKPDATVARTVEAALTKYPGRTFPTIVRRVDYLRKLLEADPYSDFRLSPKAKRVVTFLRKSHKATLHLPIEMDGARILAMNGREIFTAYVPSPRGAVFMALIEKTFGSGLTTRTWGTVKKCAAM